MGERVGDVTRAAGEVPPRRDSYADGVIASPVEPYSRLYPSSDVLGISPELVNGRDQDDIGAGYGVADQHSNPNAVPGLTSGRDVDSDDL